jgi:acyl dehydratase
LRRESGGERSKEGGQSATPERPAAVWSVPEDIGRRYAAVSGDRNPIHLHALSARLFGLPRAIAHGMWLKARCLGALEGELPESLSVEVAFKRPLLLPSRVEFSSWPADGGTAFAVHRAGGGEPHLEGRVGPAAR